MKEKYIPTQAEKNSKMNRKKAIIPVALIALLLCVLAAGTLVAKYISERDSDGVVRASNFYFTSDFLDDKEHTLTPGSTSVSFTVGNHADELRYSEVDINYTVEVKLKDSGTSAAKVEIKGGTGTSVAGNTGMLATGSVKDDTVTISDLEAGKTYEVTAVGKGGYTKTLKATIVVPVSGPQLYYHIDDSAGEYTLLTVWNEGDTEGKVNITYTGIPDNTNPNMGSWETGGEGSEQKSRPVEIGSHKSKVFRFFDTKKDGITVKDKNNNNVNTKDPN